MMVTQNEQGEMGRERLILEIMRNGNLPQHYYALLSNLLDCTEAELMLLWRTSVEMRNNREKADAGLLGPQER